MKFNTTPVYTHVRNHIAKFLLFLNDHQNALIISVRFYHLSSQSKYIFARTTAYTHVRNHVAKFLLLSIDNKTRFSTRCDSAKYFCNQSKALLAYRYTHVRNHIVIDKIDAFSRIFLPNQCKSLLSIVYTIPEDLHSFQRFGRIKSSRIRTCLTKDDNKRY